MSGVYIKGMKMPTKENVVILINPQGGVWMIGDMPNEDTHLAKAKAVPVPPHGRLIDADALIKSLSLDESDAENGASLLMAIFLEVLKAAPTIIPANKEDADEES